MKINNKQPRFDMPTDKQLIDLAILFNNGQVNLDKLTDMVAMCEFVLNRLYENGTVLKPSLKEVQTGDENLN